MLRLPLYLHIKRNSDVSQAVMLIWSIHKNSCHLLTQLLFTLTALILIFVNYPTTTTTDPVYVDSYLLESGHLYNIYMHDIYLKDLMNNIYLQQLNFGILLT